MTTIYEREKRYNSEAGGRLAEDQRDTQENVEKVNNSRECQQKGLQLQILLHGDFFGIKRKYILHIVHIARGNERATPPKVIFVSNSC